MSLSTYGEAATVLALARRDHQVAIIRNFLDDLPERLADLEVQYLVGRNKLRPDCVAKKKAELERRYAMTARFPRLTNFFHYRLDEHTSTALLVGDVVTPEQREVLQLWAGMKPREWLDYDQRIQDAELSHNQGLVKRLQRDAADLHLEGLQDDSHQDERDYWRQEYSRRQKGALDYRARVAAMDALLRRVMQATEEDLEAQFVRPALAEVREAASSRGVTLSTVERNSVIAMNRSPARTDPQATFEIQLPPKVDWLKETRNAVSLAAAVQSGAFTGFLSQLEKTRPSTLDDTPGTYFVESGNEVEFTPIVGPDGQAIRMQVNFHRYNPVRLPNREQGQNYGKIERHNIDTDVQDTNFELIEIGRFEGQTTIGENRQRRGGLPILNQIPIIQEIPLIGYFTRERQRVTGNQESLVFLQTAVYPSITDMLGLFTEGDDN